MVCISSLLVLDDLGRSLKERFQHNHNFFYSAKIKKKKKKQQQQITISFEKKKLTKLFIVITVQGSRTALYTCCVILISGVHTTVFI